MTVYELTYVFVIVILLYRALYNILVFLKNRNCEFLAFFALTQIAFALYMICLLKTINVKEPGHALLFERFENACLPIMSIFFLLFAQRFRAVIPVWLVWVFVTLNIVLSIIILVYPGAYHIGLLAPKTFPALGVTIYETIQPVWVMIFIFSDLIGMVAIVIRYVQNGMFQESDSRVVLVALILFFVLGVSDMAVSLGLFEMPYIAHFGFLGVMLSVENLFKIEVRYAANQGSKQTETNDTPSGIHQVQSLRAQNSVSSRQAASSETASGIIRISVLGPLEMRSASGEISFQEIATKRKLLKLFKLLLVRFGKGIHREELLEALYPGSPEAAGLNNLHALLFRLRKSFGNPDSILFVEDRIYLNQDLVRLDLQDFEKALDDARSALNQKRGIHAASEAMARASALYRGSFFEFDPYFEGVSEIQGSLIQKYKQNLIRLCEVSLRETNAAELVSAADLAVRLDEVDEEAWRYLFLGLELAGKRGEALKRYATLVKVLKKELDVSPDEETEELIARIRGPKGAT